MGEQAVKKIIFLIPTLAGGGAERVVSELSCGMPADIEQHIVLFTSKVGYPHKSELSSLGLDACASGNLLLKPAIILKRFIRFRKMAKRIKPDVVISFLQGNILNVLVGLSLGRNRYRIVLSERTATSEIALIMKGFYGLINRTVMKFLYRRADHIIAVSAYIKNCLVEKFGVDPSKVSVIYNPVDSERITALARESVNHPWFGEKIPIIINVGRLSAQKNQRELILALPELKGRSDCRLVIVGRGELEEELRRLAASLGVERRVLFLGHQDNPFKYIAGSTVFVLPSLYEGFPNALVEAMAAGCPVVAADCPSGPSEILKPESPECGISKGLVETRYGMLFAAGDRQAMISGIKKLIDDGKIRLWYTESAKKRVVDFNTKTTIDRYLAVLGGR